MTALFIHVAYRQQIHLMLFKADRFAEEQTIEGFIMQIFSHIEVQLLLNDNNVCCVANHIYIGGWASNQIKSNQVLFSDELPFMSSSRTRQNICWLLCSTAIMCLRWNIPT